VAQVPVKRILLDVNVLLDAILERPAHADAAAKLWALAEAGEIEALVPAHGVTTLFYLLARAKGAAAARRTVESIAGTFGIAPVDGAVIRRALGLGWPDFEDSVCAAAAEASGCESLVSRDPAGFPDAPLPVLEPATATALLTGGPDRVAEGAEGPRRRGRSRRPPRRQAR